MSICSSTWNWPTLCLCCRHPIACEAQSLAPGVSHCKLLCSGTSRATRELITTLPTPIWMAVGSKCLPPLHPLLHTQQPWAYAQQQVQLHARIMTPSLWFERGWIDFSAMRCGRLSADCQLHVSITPSALLVSSVASGRTQGSCPLLAGEYEALTGTGHMEFSLSPDGSRLALIHWPHFLQHLPGQRSGVLRIQGLAAG